MDYTTQIVKSGPGLTQHEALLTLQNNRNFKPGTKIASIHNQAGHWVAKLMVPKVSMNKLAYNCPTCQEDTYPDGYGCMNSRCKDKNPEAKAINMPAVDETGQFRIREPQGTQYFPQEELAKRSAGAFEDIDESPADLHEEKHEEKESPLEEMEEHKINDHEEKHEQSEEKKIAELEKKIDLLLDALGISEKGESPDKMPEGPEGPAADLPAAPPKGGPADSPKKPEPLPPGSGAKLKPGEVPNKPGVTPVGAPSFASVKKSVTSMPPNAAPVGTGQTTSDPVPTPAPASIDDQERLRQEEMASQRGATPSPASPVTAFTASKADPMRDISIKMAKAQLENAYQGFRVARIKRAGDTIHARLEKS